MAEQRTRQDSSRDLLEELEDGWASSSSGAGAPTAADSIPDVNDLDEGWLDQLFPDEEDDDEEDEEPEAELPDERLDPVAFAEAKKAQAERQAARKERKKQKHEAKRARQRAKAAAMRQKQKGKAKRKPATAPQKPEKKLKAARPPVDVEAEADEGSSDANVVETPRPKKSIATAAPRRANTVQSIKLLAIVLGVLLALAAAVAVLTK